MTASDRTMAAPKTLRDVRTNGYLGAAEAAARPDWNDGRMPRDSVAVRTRAPGIGTLPPNARPHQARPGAFFMSESIEDFDVGARFLDRLSDGEKALIRERGQRLLYRQNDLVFSQGERHEGIYIIEQGQVRVYYTAPSAREITLAYWTPGHFVGGPEIVGGGVHVWSGVAIDDCEITMLSSATLQKLLSEIPGFALAMIDGLVAKGKCYSSMAQMLGTRSVIERLAQYLVNLAELHGVPAGDAIVIHRKVTHDQIAAMVGSTRQWVTMMLKRFQAKRIVSVDGGVIRIERLDLLEQILFKE